MLIGGHIHVLGSEPPAAALLVRAGRVARVGGEAEVRAAAPAGATTMDLRGTTVTPGITDAHIHLTSWALARRRIEFAEAPTLHAALARVADAARAPGEGWLRGHGWDANRWGALPARDALDATVADRPVYLDSHDLHAAWLNSEALRRSGITRHTSDPPGGQIVRDPATGEPTGVLLENAKGLVEPHLPTPGPREIDDALLDAQRELHRWGITGVHSVERSGLEDFARLGRNDRLRLRVLQAIQLDRLDAAIADGLRSGEAAPGTAGDRGWLRIGGVKMFLDGALGSRTAWLREPYLDTDGDRGIQTLPSAEFQRSVARAAAAGIATTVHAIGDAAVELALDVLGAVAPPAAMPHRIEHLQLCPPDLWARAARSGIVASMQPVHLLTDIPAAERHWGHERSRGAYAFAPLLDTGTVLAFGSDAPVETPDPRQGLLAATRRLPRGSGDASERGEWYPEHRLTPEQALRAYTEGPAWAAGDAGHQGRLLPGYHADLAAWSVDPVHAAPGELRDMHCVLSVVAGEIVHRTDPVG